MRDRSAQRFALVARFSTLAYQLVLLPGAEVVMTAHRLKCSHPFSAVHFVRTWRASNDQPLASAQANHVLLWLRRARATALVAMLAPGEVVACSRGFMRGWIAGLILILTSPVWGAECIDGDTLIVDGTDFRLDGIDAPEFNQICLDEKARSGRAVATRVMRWPS